MREENYGGRREFRFRSLERSPVFISFWNVAELRTEQTKAIYTLVSGGDLLAASSKTGLIL